MRIMRGGSSTESSASILLRARFIAASTAMWVVITTGTASPGARPRWIIDSIDTCSSRSGAATFHHHAADKIALGDNGVVDALDGGNRSRPRHHAGMDALLQPLLGQAR